MKTITQTVLLLLVTVSASAQHRRTPKPSPPTGGQTQATKVDPVESPTPGVKNRADGTEDYGELELLSKVPLKDGAMIWLWKPDAPTSKYHADSNLVTFKAIFVHQHTGAASDALLFDTVMTCDGAYRFVSYIGFNNDGSATEATPLNEGWSKTAGTGWDKVRVRMCKGS
jgi:hypothetical protein